MPFGGPCLGVPLSKHTTQQSWCKRLIGGGVEQKAVSEKGPERGRQTDRQNREEEQETERQEKREKQES